jgi:hypothetical protein
MSSWVTLWPSNPQKLFITSSYANIAAASMTECWLEKFCVKMYEQLGFTIPQYGLSSVVQSLTNFSIGRKNEESIYSFRVNLCRHFEWYQYFSSGIKGNLLKFRSFNDKISARCINIQNLMLFVGSSHCFISFKSAIFT